MNREAALSEAGDAVRPGVRGRLRAGTATRALAVLVLLFGTASLSGPAQAKQAPRPAATPPPAMVEVASLADPLREIRRELAELRTELGELGALRSELASLGSRLDAAANTATEVKGVVEPMREEVRGLYVETSNVRSEIARLEQTYVENTQALGRSRYVLTLLLVATNVLQLVVLAVLVRSR